MFRFALSFAPWLCWGMAACAAQPALEMRVMVKLLRADLHPQEVVAQVQASSGQSASYAAAVGPQWHSVLLRCANQDACDAALQRLRNDAVHFEAIQIERRVRPLSSSDR